MRRGDIVLVRLDPVIGRAANKTRPALIVGRDSHTQTSARLGRGVVTVVPLTSNVARVLSFQVLLRADDCGLDRDSKAQVEQIRSVDITRVGERIGAASSEQLIEVDRALRLHLFL